MSWALINKERVLKNQAMAANIIRTDFKDCLVDIIKANIYHLSFVNKILYFDELKALIYRELPWENAWQNCHPNEICKNVISNKNMGKFYLYIYNGD